MDINEAIIRYGAKAVYAAAYRHSGGDTTRGLHTVGLEPKTMGDVWATMREAYAQMSEADRAIDYAQSTSDLEARYKR